MIAVDDISLGTPENSDDAIGFVEASVVDGAAAGDVVFHLAAFSSRNVHECPFDGYVHDTIADYSAFHEATGWEPKVSFEEGVEFVCEPYRSPE